MFSRISCFSFPYNECSVTTPVKFLFLTLSCHMDLEDLEYRDLCSLDIQIIFFCVFMIEIYTGLE